MEPIEILGWLFYTEGFSAPGGWSIWMMAFVRLFNLVIGISYIGTCIFFLAVFRQRIRSFMFPIFTTILIISLILNGATHLFDAFIFWWPAYRFSLLVDFLTAVFTAPILFAFPKIAWFLLGIPSRRELIEANHALAGMVNHLESMRAHSQIYTDRLDKALQGIKASIPEQDSLEIKDIINGLYSFTESKPEH